MASLLPLHNFYSILIRLLEPSSSEAGETWVRNMAAEFLLTKHLFHDCKVLTQSSLFLILYYLLLCCLFL
jgi:hypothetical protein